MAAAHTFPVDQRDVVDLRSDTVTRPTPEMFEAMRSMPVGDDVLGDDPTVVQLERLAADQTGKEAALFVPSGTMGNQIALAVHCSRGDAILIEEEAHILYYEGGSPAVLAGVVSWTLPSDGGVMDPSAVESRILKRSEHTPATTLLCLENTHNRAGGTIIPIGCLAAYREVADRHGIRIHLDGARVFNAAVALNTPVHEITRYVDTVNFCLSKGLRAPVGSLLCGPKDFIEKARYWRKRLGGGMRQAGLLAACGIISLTQMVDRLAEDHARAKRLASALAELPGLRVESERVQTNMVLLYTDRPAAEW
ncbi:MAG TPA: threonine aldolase family protein, partial [Fimbriimonadaceae bacterium]|nr:threonine aldolase family protein [Fimbriimonadaceae bacterium]